ncbi:MAG: hypothetical protein L0207_07115 [Chlamydiae bacterium]|nr:hypothetical protein [Chlamydiota bacterium]
MKMPDLILAAIPSFVLSAIPGVSIVNVIYGGWKINGKIREIQVLKNSNMFEKLGDAVDIFHCSTLIGTAFQMGLACSLLIFAAKMSLADDLIISTDADEIEKDLIKKHDHILSFHKKIIFCLSSVIITLIFYQISLMIIVPSKITFTVD